jgi:coenzyme F420 hydrogenase subunit beta
MENFSFEAAGRQRLEEMLQIDLSDIDKLNVKEDVIITLRDGRTVHVPFDQLDDVARPACLACTDFANDYADLSAGGLSSPNGYTTILTRTERGSGIYSRALSQGYIEEMQTGGWAAMRAAEGRMGAEVIAFAERKRARGEARLIKLRSEGGTDRE